MALANGIEDVLGMSEGNFHPIKLVLKATLRKFGNAHGDSLTNEKKVVGQQSDVEAYTL
jgi:hypothetical protein